LFRGDTRAEPFRAILADTLLLVSFMSIAELDRWTLSRNWGNPRRGRLEAFLAQFTLVLPDRELCRSWAMVVDGARRRGRPIQTADAWIAATALAKDALLVTHNRNDFAGVEGLQVFDPDGSAAAV
jgi:predicted nucleic acid-binding protein